MVLPDIIVHNKSIIFREPGQPENEESGQPENEESQPENGESGGLTEGLGSAIIIQIKWESIGKANTGAERMKILNNWKRLLLLGLGALLLIGILVVGLQNAASKRERAEILERAAPLERQRDELVDRRDRLQREHYERIQGKATEQILFLELDPLLVSEVFPLMQEWEIPGVLGLSEGNFPDDPGRISRAEYDSLLAAGWETCLVCEGAEDFAAWDRAMTERLGQAGIDKPRAVYFEEDAFRADWQEQIAACGYTVAVHHGEDGLSLIGKGAEGALWLSGAHPWNYVGVSEEIASLVEQHGQHCFTLRFSEGREHYAAESFRRMLEFVKPYLDEDSLEITGFLKARDLHDPEKNGVNAATEQWKREDEELARQIRELNRQIDGIYKEWSAGNDD